MSVFIGSDMDPEVETIISTLFAGFEFVFLLCLYILRVPNYEVLMCFFYVYLYQCDTLGL